MLAVVETKHRNQYLPGIYMLLELAGGGDLFDKIGTSDVTESQVLLSIIC